MRCFVAVDIPNNLKEEIYRVLEGERKRFRELKWVAMENFHITLKFLGSVERERIKKIKEVLERVAEKHSPFKLKPDSLGTFPEKGSLKVLWLSLVDGEKIKSLATDVENSLTSIGFPKEKRPFTPHLTLARARRNSKERITLDDFEVKRVQFPYFLVDHFTLYESELKPDGPIYKKIVEFKLKK